MNKTEKLKIIEEFELGHGFTYMTGLYDFFEKAFELGKSEGITIGKNLKIDELLKVDSPTTRKGMVCLKHRNYMLNYCGACYYEDIQNTKKEILEEVKKIIGETEEWNPVDESFYIDRLKLEEKIEALSKGQL